MASPKFRPRLLMLATKFGAGTTPVFDSSYFCSWPRSVARVRRSLSASVAIWGRSRSEARRGAPPRRERVTTVVTVGGGARGKARCLSRLIRVRCRRRRVRARRASSMMRRALYGRVLLLWGGPSAASITSTSASTWTEARLSCAPTQSDEPQWRRCAFARRTRSTPRSKACRARRCSPRRSSCTAGGTSCARPPGDHGGRAGRTRADTAVAPAPYSLPLRRSDDRATVVRDACAQLALLCHRVRRARSRVWPPPCPTRRSARGRALRPGRDQRPPRMARRPRRRRRRDGARCGGALRLERGGAQVRDRRDAGGATGWRRPGHAPRNSAQPLPRPIPAMAHARREPAAASRLAVVRRSRARIVAARGTGPRASACAPSARAAARADALPWRSS